MSWVELDRILMEEIVRDDDIRRRVAESGRPPRSHATGMSDNDLLAKLCGLGADTDREKLAGFKKCCGALRRNERTGATSASLARRFQPYDRVPCQRTG